MILLFHREEQPDKKSHLFAGAMRNLLAGVSLGIPTETFTAILKRD